MFASRGLRGADLGEESVDRRAQHAGLVVEFAGIREHVGAAVPVAAAAVVTPPMWALISLEPAATDWMLRAISRVAAPCSSMALEMLTVISLICAMVPVMPPIDCTASLVEACIAATCAEISSVALAVWLASAFTSEATTAKPRPDSPARAASMVALSASRLVCAAIEWISCTTSPIFSAPLDSA